MKPAEIMDLVAEVCGVTTEQMQGRNRSEKAVFAKYITVMMLIEERTSNKQIIALFPNHHRTTTINNSKISFEELITYDKKFKALYLEAIRRRCHPDLETFKTL